MKKNEKRKIAVVTGTGRLKGIGYVICSELAKQNFDIFFTYWSPYDRQMPWELVPDEPLQIQENLVQLGVGCACMEDRKSTRLNSSHVRISYAVFCLKKKKRNK